MDEFERTKMKLLGPLLTEMGAALIDCQTFEYGIALLLLHLSRVGVPGLEPAAHFAIMDNRTKKTAGQLIAMLKTKINVGKELEDALTDALDARNLLMHRAFVDNVERIPDPKERAEFVREIRRLRSRVQRADSLIRPIVEEFSKLIDGIELKRLADEVRSMMLGETQQSGGAP